MAMYVARLVNVAQSTVAVMMIYVAVILPWNTMIQLRINVSQVRICYISYWLLKLDLWYNHFMHMLWSLFSSKQLCMFVRAMTFCWQLIHSINIKYWDTAINILQEKKLVSLKKWLPTPYSYAINLKCKREK